MATVQGVYIALFGRPADPLGLQFYNNLTNNGQNLQPILAQLATSPEYTGRFTGQSNVQIVNSVYQDLFGRDADVTGLTFYVNALNTGTLNIAQIAVAILDGARGTDATIVTNKLAAANLFTASIDTSAEIVAYDASAIPAAQAFLDGVTADAATVPTQAQVDAAITAIVNAPDVPVTTTVLTVGTDVLNGTAGNDAFVAGLGGATGALATLNAGDSINGGAGTDRIDLFGDVNTASFASANVTNVEQVFAQFDTVAGSVLDVSGNTGVQQAWVSKGDITGGATVTLNKAQTAGITGAVAGGSELAFAFKDATAGTADAASLALNGATLATGGSVKVNAIETLSVSATGANNLRTLNSDSVGTLNIAGAGDVSLVAAGNGSFKAIAAGSATGKLTLDLAATAGGETLTIATGTGADTVTANWATQTSADKIDLGGGVDKLLFSDAVTVSTSAQAANLSGVTNVEKLGTVNALLTVDGDLVSQTIFTTSGNAGDVDLSNVKNGSTVEFGAGNLQNSAVAMKLGSNTLNVELNGSSTGNANLGAGLAVTGSSTLNIASTGTAGQPANVIALTAADNQAVNITGAQDLTLTATNAGGTTGFNINGAAATGKLVVTGTNSTDILVGGAAADTLDGGGSVGTAAVSEVFTATFAGDEAGGDTTITFDGVTSTLNTTPANGTAIAADFTADYNAAAGKNWVAVANGDGTVTFTAATTGARTDVTSADFVVTANTADDTAITVTAAAPTTQGANAVAGVTFTADTFTGGAGNDTFIVGTNGAAAAADADVITDFLTKADKIDFSAYNVAGSSTNYVEGAAAVADYAAALAAANATFNANATVLYSAQQVGSDTFVFAAAGADTSAQHVVKLTGVALTGIEFGDIVA